MPKEPSPKPDDAPVAASDEAPIVAADEPEPLPGHKDELVAVAIDRGIPSYEAWGMTVPELTKRLES